jgi:hypothetical protein
LEPPLDPLIVRGCWKHLLKPDEVNHAFSDSP